MAKIVTLLSIVGSIASVVGLYAIYQTQNSVLTPDGWWIVLIVTTALCTYVLFVPGNSLEENVRNKIKKYHRSPPDDSKLFVQEGVQILYGTGPLSVKFPAPYASPPEVELINNLGCGETPGCFPKVKEVTRYQFVVDRSIARQVQGENKYYPDQFGWIATGQVMSEVTDAAA